MVELLVRHVSRLAAVFSLTDWMDSIVLMRTNQFDCHWCSSSIRVSEDWQLQLLIMDVQQTTLRHSNHCSLRPNVNVEMIHEDKSIIDRTKKQRPNVFGQRHCPCLQNVHSCCRHLGCRIAMVVVRTDNTVLRQRWRSDGTVSRSVPETRIRRPVLFYYSASRISSRRFLNWSDI